jgi:predicted neutral ceramidase superfamily lipid hydrolase
MQACPVQPQWKRSFPDRLVSAIRLDVTVFDEVEHDPDAIGQAFWVVVLGSIVGTGLIWLIGVRMMGCTSDYAELLRTVGFASAPKVLFLIGVLPLGAASYLLGLLIMILTTVASVLAVRQALDVTTGRAVMVCIVAMVASFVIAAVLGAFIGMSMGVLGAGGSAELPGPEAALSAVWTVLAA